jgi:redox-sensitive bicupin YhaK (pirin superfamily)
MIRTVSVDSLGGYEAPGIRVRDHFRKVPENSGGSHFCLGPLRTLADTTIEAGTGFPLHGHAEMEIISYLCEGELVHADTLGRHGRLRPGDVQAMTTGTGIRHSESNGGDSLVRLYQLWIEPELNGLEPSYVDVAQPKGGVVGSLRVLASGMAAYPGGAPINVDAALFGADLETGQSLTHPLPGDRQAYVLAAHGRFTVNGVELGERDGAEVADVEALSIEALEDCDVVVVDLPKR